MDDLMDKELWKRREVVKKDGVWTVEGHAFRTQTMGAAQHSLNVYRQLACHFTSKSGVSWPIHICTALTATILKGKALNQMIHPGMRKNAQGNSEVFEMDSGVQSLAPGQTWYEPPGCHHVRSENPSDEEECVFVVNFVIETAKLDAAEKQGHIGLALVVYDVDKAQKL